MLEQQKKQIEQLKTALEAQQKMLEQYIGAPAAAPAVEAAPAPAPAPAIPVVASTTPMLPPPASTPAPRPTFALPPQAPDAAAPAPLSLKIGEAYITPVGFMDMTGVFRSANGGSGIPTNFGSIPFNNAPTARLTETRLNPQNSRIGARVDTLVHGAKVTGYWESDFLGTSGTNNLSASNNAWVFRLRLYWVDVKKGNFEILGGQSWSMMTPGRNGISPLPSDIFYSQNMDPNYEVGLIWNRSPGFRFVYHPSDTFAAGLSFENADQYIGGSGGATTIGYPTNSNIATNYANELDSSANSTQTPNLHPDIIGKIAFDPKTGNTHQHIELAGVYSTFKVFNPAANGNLGQSFTAPGVGGELNMNFELVKNVHLILNGFASDGAGRYMFGQAPDLVIQGSGGITPLHSYSGIGGFEANVAPNSLLYGYYGDYYIGRTVIVDTAGKLGGWGFTGSSNGQNRNILEPTLGLNQTIWKNPAWGALNFIFQYSYLSRSPWYVAPGAPKNAHNSSVWIDLRYTLPGQPPALK
jgi:hypothetical protein